MDDKTWISPDGKITKTIIVPGRYGLKPTENCECVIKIASCYIDVRSFNDAPVIIGEIDTNFGRLLEKSLMMMNAGEIASVSFQLQEADISSIVELKSFMSNGYIYEWDAGKKYSLAVKQKNMGVELYKTTYIDASYRFSKAVKLLAAIPIEVESSHTVIDGVPLADIYNLKANLYNNLASCYFKHKEYDIVIDLCNRALEIDQNNVKALYKIGVSYNEVHNFDRAYDMLKKLVTLDPSNKAAAEQLRNVVVNINKTNAEVNAMVKRMFV